jgi:hypothetical protein
VSRRLRHSSTSITNRFYAGRTPRRDGEAAELRAAAIPRRRPRRRTGDEGAGGT